MFYGRRTRSRMYRYSAFSHLKKKNTIRKLEVVGEVVAPEGSSNFSSIAYETDDEIDFD